MLRVEGGLALFPERFAPMEIKMKKLIIALIASVLPSISFPATLQAVAKVADTTRAGPTVSADPELVFSSEPAGTYALTCFLVFKVPATSEDFQFNVYSTGAALLGRFQATIADNLGDDLGSENAEIEYQYIESPALTPSSMVSVSVHSILATSSPGSFSINWGEYEQTGGITLRAGSWCELAQVL